MIIAEYKSGQKAAWKLQKKLMYQICFLATLIPFTSFKAASWLVLGMPRVDRGPLHTGNCFPPSYYPHESSKENK